MRLSPFGRREDQFENSPAGDTLPRSSRRFKILPLLIFAIFGLYYYFSHQEQVPLTGRTQLVAIDPKTEMALGLQSYRQVLAQSELVSAGPEVQMVNEVGRRIAKASENKTFEWQFSVLRSSEINAFCLPGGKVAVYSGIIPVAKDLDGLAVVLGHEIAHAIARHGAERMAHEQLAQYGQMAMGMAVSEMDYQQRRVVMGALGLGAQFGVLLPFSRKHESEADYMGLIYMARACFDPRQAPLFWKRMAQASERGQPPQFLSTHPNHDTRVEQLAQWMPEALAEMQKHCSK